jgi:hypothetical protein
VCVCTSNVYVCDVCMYYIIQSGTNNRLASFFHSCLDSFKSWHGKYAREQGQSVCVVEVTNLQIDGVLALARTYTTHTPHSGRQCHKETARQIAARDEAILLVGFFPYTTTGSVIVHFLYTFLYSITEPVVLCNFSSDLLLLYMKLGRSWYIGAPADKFEFGGNVSTPSLSLSLSLSLRARYRLSVN